MSNIKSYVRRSLTHHANESKIRAIKVTERNYVSAKDWAGKWTDAEASIKVGPQGDVTNHKVRVKTKKGWRVAKPGDYIVKFANEADGGLHIAVIKHDEFIERYEPAKA
jgi:hypothetical protein